MDRHSTSHHRHHPTPSPSPSPSPSKHFSLTFPASDTTTPGAALHTAAAHSIPSVPPVSLPASSLSSTQQHPSVSSVSFKPHKPNTNSSNSPLPRVASDTSLSSYHSYHSYHSCSSTHCHHTHHTAEICDNINCPSATSVPSMSRSHSREPSPAPAPAPAPPSNSIANSIANSTSSPILSALARLYTSHSTNPTGDASPGNDTHHQDLKQTLSDADEKKEQLSLSNHSSNESSHTQKALQSMVSSPQFMESAIAMYGSLDAALTALKSATPRSRSDVNAHVLSTMKTLIASTTHMGAMLSNDAPHGETSNAQNGSVFGSLLARLSSSVSYMSYVSVRAVTPLVYSMVETVLVEIYATVKDVIEYYDPEPKNNVVWRIIDKMNQIIEAIRGLLALSDAYYEVDDEDDDEEEDDDDGIVFGGKQKKD